MARLALTTLIGAPIERCFDLARDLDLHTRSLAHTAERAVAGRTSGLIELGESVTWQARHFGILHRHTSTITAYERPTHFCDEMTEGRFGHFRHDHFFESVPSGTRMTDELDYAAPLGVVGRLVERLVLDRYLTRLLVRRNDAIRRAAEERT